MALPSHLILPLLMIIGTTADTTIVKLMKVFLNTEAPTYLKLGHLYLKTKVITSEFIKKKSTFQRTSWHQTCNQFGQQSSLMF